MILYHFTASYNVPYIKKSGISRGDVPITITGGYNAPWFTSDPNPASQGWDAGGPKSEIRITVNFPDGDKNLLKWTDVIKGELDALDNPSDKKSRKAWYDVLNQVGGSGQDNWYIYKGVVPASWIKKIEKAQ